MVLSYEEVLLKEDVQISKGKRVRSATKLQASGNTVCASLDEDCKQQLKDKYGSSTKLCHKCGKFSLCVKCWNRKSTCYCITCFNKEQAVATNSEASTRVEGMLVL